MSTNIVDKTPRSTVKFTQRKTVRLNGAYLMTTLGDRMWMFAIGIFMHKLGGMSWVAVQQFLDALLKLGTLPLLGTIMDKMNRRKVIQYSLALNNVCVAISALCFCVCFYGWEGGALGYRIIPFTIAIVFASASRVASEAQRICFTKDWIVVITSSFPEEGVSLSQQNAFMSLIDQVSSIILPFFTGFMIESFGWTISCTVIIIYNLCSWAIENYLLINLYDSAPALHKRVRTEEASDNEEQTSFSWRNSLRLYFQQSSWLAGFGLTLLYMTVLGFDNLAGSYGQKHGMSLSVLGGFRTAGSVLGALGAVTFGFLQPLVGLLWTAFIGLTWQNLFIFLSGTSTILPGSPMNLTGYVDNFGVKSWLSGVVEHIQKPQNDDLESVSFFQLPTSIILFFVGITLARFGLWMADPAITQIQQETIPEAQRYSVFTMQTAFCEGFSLLKDTIVILFPNTELFGGLAIMSCIFVFTGYLFNIAYFLQCGCSTKKDGHKPIQQTDVEMIEEPEKTSLLNHVEEKNEANIIEEHNEKKEEIEIIDGNGENE